MFYWIKNILLSSVFCCLSFVSLAQQIGMYSHYFYKPMIYNPAFTGSGDGTNIMLINHAQWSGFKDAPRLNFFTVDRNFMNKKTGLGLQLISDKKGINNRIGGNLLYSYRMNINDNTHLSLGLSFGIINQALDYSKALVESAADPTLFSISQQKTTYDGNAGLAFVCKGFEFGLAVPQLLENKISYTDNTSHAHYTQARHYMGSLKYKFFISKDKGISFVPQGLVRFVANTPLQYDGNINLEWNNKFWIGATYKSDYAIAANIGFCIFKQFSVGYSYDIITGSIGTYSGMSHEIMVHVQLGANKKIRPKATPEDSSSVVTKAKEPDPVLEEPEKVEIKKNDFKPIIVETPKVENKIPEAVPVVKETPKVVPFDYAAYRKHRLDSLEQLKVKEEQEKVKANRQEENTKKPEVIQNKSNSDINNKVWIGTDQARDFKDVNNQLPPTGYYVVVRSFHDRNLALAEVKRLLTEGLKNTNWIYFEPTKFNYVFIGRVDTKKEAFKQAINARVAGYEDVWIQRIIE